MELYGVHFKLTIKQFLCDRNCESCHRYAYRVRCRRRKQKDTHLSIALKCIASRHIYSISEPDADIYTDETEIGPSLSSRLLVLVSGKIRRHHPKICRNTENTTAWAFPRRFTGDCMQALKLLTYNHEFYVRASKADLCREFLKWLEIDFYETPIFRRIDRGEHNESKNRRIDPAREDESQFNVDYSASEQEIAEQKRQMYLWL